MRSELRRPQWCWIWCSWVCLRLSVVPPITPSDPAKRECDNQQLPPTSVRMGDMQKFVDARSPNPTDRAAGVVPTALKAVRKKGSAVTGFGSWLPAASGSASKPSLRITTLHKIHIDGAFRPWRRVLIKQSRLRGQVAPTSGAWGLGRGRGRARLRGPSLGLPRACDAPEGHHDGRSGATFRAPPTVGPTFAGLRASSTGSGVHQ